MIIGLSGYAGAGKDTVGQILVSDYGFKRLAFADTLKSVAKRLHYWNGQKDDLGRRHLQELGQILREEICESIWVDTVFKQIDFDKNYVITDVRYENELQTIQNYNGYIYRVLRGQPVNNHISEQLPEHYFKYNGYLINDGTIDELKDQIADMIKYLNGLSKV